MEKHCNTCGREVKETVHTATGAVVDYFETHKKNETKVTCVGCLGREMTEPIRNMPSISGFLHSIDKQENTDH